ncbi:MAG: DUF1501 domain-containing protein [Burkholderiales bacterium]|nr:DUF1501 domain-containing protein [Burkholderiales bacterium]
MSATAGLSSLQRRRLLKAAAACGLLGAIERNFALAQSASDYKALVCVDLLGGNDGENTLIRFDTAGYAAYSAVRPPASGINIGQSALLPIQPTNMPTPFGFHPSCGPLRDLFDTKRLAVVANMGPLAQPSTRVALETGSQPRPANLFSHSDQQLGTQSLDYKLNERTGWGGRIADRLDAATPGQLFPALVTVRGGTTFTAGRTSLPLAIPEEAFFDIGYTAPGNLQYDALRDAALREILAQQRGNIYEVVAQAYARDGLSASSVIVPIVTNPASVVVPHFANQGSSIAKQLRSVAQLIEGREQVGRRRQVFYVQQSSYDTHGDQIKDQGRLLFELSRALGAFTDAMAALGLADKVTAFTTSEFGRAWRPAANKGTDHGWGNYAFVVGGAVRGGEFYGKLPVQALNGPDDLGGDGRWIPTTSLEQYGATLARWLGIQEGDLPYIFPNIGAFGNTNLGFMS